MVYHRSWELQNKKVSAFQKARYKACKTLRDVANAVGVSHNAIHLYEHGIENPKKEVWEKLQAYLNLDGQYTDYFTPNVRHESNQQCAIKDCTKPTLAKGYCSKHYMQLYRKAKKGKV